MTVIPEISVVMSVYNGAGHLKESVESILSQEGVSLEFIIVNDGSTDATPEMLEGYARKDNRIRLIHQKNQGLTKSLFIGCGEARGHYIARQDADDISLPGRLKKQLDCLKANPHAVLVTCGTRFFGPSKETLYDTIQETESLTESLTSLDPEILRSVSSHGSTLFDRVVYKQTGGYRFQFRYAQDLDLWVRLAEKGAVIALSEVLYSASFGIDTISGLRRKEQTHMKKIITECKRLRQDGLDEGVELKKAITLSSKKRGGLLMLQRAKASYFIGACLLKQNDGRAKQYFIMALRYWPLHLKSLYRLAGL